MRRQRQTAALRLRQAAAAWLAMGSDDEKGHRKPTLLIRMTHWAVIVSPTTDEVIQLPLAGNMQTTRRHKSVQG